jgi:hypothetical protein
VVEVHVLRDGYGPKRTSTRELLNVQNGSKADLQPECRNECGLGQRGGGSAIAKPRHRSQSFLSMLAERRRNGRNSSAILRALAAC